MSIESPTFVAGVGALGAENDFGDESPDEDTEAETTDRRQRKRVRSLISHPERQWCVF